MPLHLAPELITLIAENLNATKDISSFAQTSRSHYASVIDSLYKRGQNDNEGRALLWACKKGEERAAELAMRNCKTDDIDTKIFIYGKALCMASANGRLPLLTMIYREVETLGDQWDPYDWDNWVDEALGEAAKHGQLHVVQFLVKQGANVNYHSTAGTPLLQAAASGHGHVVEYLLKAGANVHSTNEYGHTALCEAAKAGDVKAAEALIKHGAGVNDTNHKDEDRNTALLLAALEGHEEMVEYLLNAGANIRHINACDETALQLAVVNGHENVARLLKQRSTYFKPATVTNRLGATSSSKSEARVSSRVADRRNSMGEDSSGQENNSESPPTFSEKEYKEAMIRDMDLHTLRMQDPAAFERMMAIVQAEYATYRACRLAQGAIEAV
jgi:hypothetical protein